ncbi:hypothetical protein H0274_05820 [Altererythrobacter sp. CC-YST694]|uniref:hypothetical protein n=1 Tax=Altererythrobacter sp. CC-YST694 TaxID=2755038 RepID=UPI001D0176C5|nr:hypothetical protein [Altererythrobacter sp. CC-YST694]MCB5424766.1 hypothetical protein [Altererythrobacter sp. CC-YST694]
MTGMKGFSSAARSAVLAVGLALLLTGCFLSPGKFDSALEIRKDGAFAFSYKGEIYVLGLSKLAEMGDALESDQPFEASPCYDENIDERECSDEEIEQQKRDWEVSKANKKAEDARNAKAFGAMFGGIDPSDPAAAEELAASLRRQHGWNNVEYKGDGLYVVDFAVAGRLDHDFTFPVLEGSALSNNFVIANRRNGGVVRVDAPGYAVQSSSPSASSGLLQAASLYGEDEAEGADSPRIPELNGTFTITTDAAILANNTDEGAQASPKGQMLSWKVNRRKTNAPMALIQLTR